MVHPIIIITTSNECETTKLVVCQCGAPTMSTNPGMGARKLSVLLTRTITNFLLNGPNNVNKLSLKIETSPIYRSA